MGTLHIHRLSVNIFKYLQHILGMWTLPSLHIYVGSDHFWGFKIFIFNIVQFVWVFRKMNIFEGMKNCGYYKTGLFGVCVCGGGAFLYILRFF